MKCLKCGREITNREVRGYNVQVVYEFVDKYNGHRFTRTAFFHKDKLVSTPGYISMTAKNVDTGKVILDKCETFQDDKYPSKYIGCQHENCYENVY